MTSPGVLPPHALSIALSADEASKRITIHVALSRESALDREAIWLIRDEMLDQYVGDHDVDIEVATWVGSDPDRAPWRESDAWEVFRVRPDRRPPLGEAAGLPTVVRADPQQLDRVLAELSSPGAVTRRLSVADAVDADDLLDRVAVALGHERDRDDDHLAGVLFFPDGTLNAPVGDAIVLVIDGMATLARTRPDEALRATVLLGELSRRMAIQGDVLRVILVDFP
jgi:hypothetical protein